jgi:hypothetical protein
LLKGQDSSSSNGIKKEGGENNRDVHLQGLVSFGSSSAGRINNQEGGLWKIRNVTTKRKKEKGRDSNTK